MRMLSVGALATCAWLVSLTAEAQTAKALTPADVGRINEVGQIAIHATTG